MSYSILQSYRNKNENKDSSINILQMFDCQIRIFRSFLLSNILKRNFLNFIAILYYHLQSTRNVTNSINLSNNTFTIKLFWSTFRTIYSALLPRFHWYKFQGTYFFHFSTAFNPNLQRHICKNRFIVTLDRGRIKTHNGGRIDRSTVRFK